MAYPEHLIKRAIELSPGRSAGEVLRVLMREFKDDGLPDERTIRRWGKDRPAIHIDEEQEKIYSSFHENWKEHYEQLASVANFLLANDLNSAIHGWTTNHPFDYILTRKNKVGDYYALTKEQLSGQLKENITLAEHKYTKWFFHCCFLPHLKGELPEEIKTKGFWDIVKEQPYQLIETLRLLAERKTFKGTCLVCKDW